MKKAARSGRQEGGEKHSTNVCISLCTGSFSIRYCIGKAYYKCKIGNSEYRPDGSRTNLGGDSIVANTSPTLSA